MKGFMNMADSDGSESMKNRDKFRRERNDNENRSRAGGKREPFDERRENGYQGRRPFRDRHSPEESSFKRRRDDNYRPNHGRDEDVMYRAPMMPFKRFLEPLDDYIKDQEAFEKYQVYKDDFNKRQIEDYFEKHKDEEWLKERYHPDYMDNQKEIVQRFIKTRLDVFLDLFEKGFIDGQAVQMDNSENLIQLMDAVVVKLTGGNNDELDLFKKPDEEELLNEIDDLEDVKNVINQDSIDMDVKPVVQVSESEIKIEEPVSDNSIEDKEVANDEEEGEEVRDKEVNSPVSESGSSSGSENDEDSDEDVPTPTTAEAPFQPSEKVESNMMNPENDTVPHHKTVSIFFRNLPATLVRSELEELCRLHDGFIRLAIWEPAPERKFTRNAWATYRHDVPIKKICWALNTSSLIREKLAKASGTNMDITVTVNRELTQRVRPVMPLTRHVDVMRRDLKYAAKLVAKFDAKHDLWNQANEEMQSEEELVSSISNSCEVPDLPGVFSSNPLMRNLDEFIKTDDNKGQTDDEAHHLLNPIKLLSDNNLARVLDRLIIYLRIVHSFDFYAVTTYIVEDLMPHRCGIFHARGDRGLSAPSPSNTANGNGPSLMFSKKEMDDYMRNFAKKMEHPLKMTPMLTDDQMRAIGTRDPEKAAEEFIKSNTQKRISKNKPYKVVWVCPLSDKKFREPMFVEKHILNKHGDKVELAKRDATYYNNYIRDPERPTLPDPPRHLLDQLFSSGNNNGESRGRRIMSPRGRFPGHMGPVNRGPMMNRFNRFQPDFYDRNTQHQAMAAVAAAAAAALYPGGSTPMDILGKNPLTAGMMMPNRGGHRGFHNGSAFHMGRPGARPMMPDRFGRRGMVSYNDLDDPNNEDF